MQIEKKIESQEPLLADQSNSHCKNWFANCLISCGSWTYEAGNFPSFLQTPLWVSGSIYLLQALKDFLKMDPISQEHFNQGTSVGLLVIFLTKVGLQMKFNSLHYKHCSSTAIEIITAGIMAGLFLWGPLLNMQLGTKTVIGLTCALFSFPSVTVDFYRSLRRCCNDPREDKYSEDKHSQALRV